MMEEKKIDSQGKESVILFKMIDQLCWFCQIRGISL